jgi:predicted anti-sigma-YlaC factor YlaD
VTCDEVRELLPDHLLGGVEGPAELEVRRHLRGCAACRHELAVLGEGLSQFARAAHDLDPPEELRGRVQSVLEQEWADHAPRPARRRWFVVGPVAAAIAIVVASLGWGISSNHRADLAAADAGSYRRLLGSLGGDEFRIGALQGVGDQPVDGTVLLYDSHEDQSWGVVLVRAPGLSGTAAVTLESGDGRTIPLRDLEFAPDGDAADWIVTGSSLVGFDHLTIRLPDGSVLARARIAQA